MNEPSIEVGKTQKGLYILDFSWLGPILDDIDLIAIHSESAWGQNITNILNHVLMKRTIVGVSIQLVIPQPEKDFADMLFMVNGVVAVDQDIIKVNEYAYI